MFEVIPNDINESIKPDYSWQGNQGNESHEYDKCNQFYSLLSGRATLQGMPDSSIISTPRKWMSSKVRPFSFRVTKSAQPSQWIPSECLLFSAKLSTMHTGQPFPDGESLAQALLNAMVPLLEVSKISVWKGSIQFAILYSHCLEKTWCSPCQFRPVCSVQIHHIISLPRCFLAHDLRNGGFSAAASITSGTSLIIPMWK